MKYLNVSVEDRVSFVELNRPELHNAFNAEMISELTKVFSDSRALAEVNVVVLRGAGASFCAGADLNWMKSMVDYSLEENRQDSLQLFDMFAAIRECEVPVVGVAHGNVFGGGLGLIAACDFALSVEATKFCFSEVKLGIAPAVISSFVRSKVNSSLAREWMLSAKVFDEKEASRGGLVNEVVSESKIEEELAKVLKRFRNNGRQAVRETKKLLGEIENDSWKKIRETSARVIAERRVSDEGQEGLRSFLEKRKPSWLEGSQK